MINIDIAKILMYVPKMNANKYPKFAAKIIEEIRKPRILQKNGKIICQFENEMKMLSIPHTGHLQLHSSTMGSLRMQLHRKCPPKIATRISCKHDAQTKSILHCLSVYLKKNSKLLFSPCQSLNLVNHAQ